jgi:hypothetical protein
MTETRSIAQSIRKLAGDSYYNHWSCRQLSENDATAIAQRYRAGVAAETAREEQKRKEQLQRNKF